MRNEIWVLAEQRENKLREISFELLAWGRKLADLNNSPLCAIVLANSMPDSEIMSLIQHGADKIYFIENPIFSNFLVEPYAHTLQYLVNTYKPEIFLAGATTTGRTVMPYLSMLLHTGLTADCTDLQIETGTGNLLQVRPAIGGNIMATIKTPDTRPQMCTVRPKSICILDADSTRKGEIIKPDVPEKAFVSRMRFEKTVYEPQNNASIEEANIVISSGLGFQGPEAITLMDSLANLLGASIGSSRPPVDQGWQPYFRQVGLSGRTISPDLYIAIGISGSVQHLAGIQTAKNIIAINNDPEAPIFKVADFGIVGNAIEVVSELNDHLTKENLTYD